jgi:hypothetical protein
MRAVKQLGNAFHTTAQIDHTEKVSGMRIFRLLQQYSWGLHPSGLKRQVTGWLVPDISRKYSGLTFKGTNHPTTRLHSPEDPRTQVHCSNTRACPRQRIRCWHLHNLKLLLSHDRLWVSSYLWIHVCYFRLTTVEQGNGFSWHVVQKPWHWRL